MTDDTFVAYFILNRRSAGQCTMKMPDDVEYPREVEWCGNVYTLVDGDPGDRESHYVGEARWLDP